MLVTREEARLYLKLDTEEDDAVLDVLLPASEQLCLDILRQEKAEKADVTVKIAVLYALGYLYEHREEADHKELVQTLSYLLSGQRREVF
mgnify:FL=1